MKRLLLPLIMLFICGTAFSQGGDLLYKGAEKNLSIYKKDSTNTTKLKEARKLIDMTVEDESVTSDPKVWLLRGNVYNTIAQQRVSASQGFEQKEVVIPELEDASLTAYDAFSKALLISTDKKDIEKTIAGINLSMSLMTTESMLAFKMDKKDLGYELQKGVISAHKTLKLSGNESPFDADNHFDLLRFQTATTAFTLARYDEAKKLYLELDKSEFEEPAIYMALYILEANHTNDDPEVAYRYLERGLTRFPEDKTLRRQQIEYLMESGDFMKASEKIRLAIKRDPKDASLLSTLGFVYETQMWKAIESEDTASVSNYYNKAIDTYQKAIDIEPADFLLQYSVGALIYNKANEKRKELVDLSDDFSEEGMKKYDEVKVEVYSLIDEAIPYFQKAESVNPNDSGTLIALRDLYAIKDDYDMVQEFKSRLENVMSGVSNEPYFKID